MAATRENTGVRRKLWRPPVSVGAIAQLGERLVRNEEVGGSIPPGSTIRPPASPSDQAGLPRPSPVAISIGIVISQRTPVGV